ncbi:LacI family DNA-binding transcriptional regulator [Actinomyces faecalis]|uniref:LacI family DNA-binding transcriptional regulator n=1 Tax=Actinomyces faecalis TaxID=2722820 RepID=UPI001556A310|nr:LacI family DNA-binding transcriptional regulator [Actinomyces faecalis]
MPRTRSSRPTQAMIAAATGFSIPTVSKALRADASISRKTRDLVLAAAADLGYPLPASPDASMSPGPPRQKRVAALFDTVTNAYATEILGGMLCAADELAATLQVHHIGVSADQMGPDATLLTQDLAARTADGADALILVTTPVSADIVTFAQERDLLLLSIDPATPPPPGLVTLSATNWRGGVQAAEHLISLGHRRIGIVAGPDSSTPTIERLAGFRFACARAGIEVDESLLTHGPYLYSTGVVHGSFLLETENPPTAVFALNDAIAGGILEAARRHGIRVPDDLSVIGFDDTSIASLCSPQVTVIRQPLQEIGAEAIRTVMDALNEGRSLGSPVELLTTLVVRSSTAAPAR